MFYGLESEVKVIFKFENEILYKVCLIGLWVNFKFFFFVCLFDSFVGSNIVIEIKFLKIFE